MNTAVTILIHSNFFFLDAALITFRVLPSLSLEAEQVIKRVTAEPRTGAQAVAVWRRTCTSPRHVYKALHPNTVWLQRSMAEAINLHDYTYM